MISDLESQISHPGSGIGSDQTKSERVDWDPRGSHVRKASEGTDCAEGIFGNRDLSQSMCTLGGDTEVVLSLYSGIVHDTGIRILLRILKVN